MTAQPTSSHSHEFSDPQVVARLVQATQESGVLPVGTLRQRVIRASRGSSRIPRREEK